jgi:hypothetical protein
VSGTYDLTACPHLGGGALTITGSNFYGTLLTVTPVVCSGLVSNYPYTTITCTLLSGTGSMGNIQIITNGGTTAGVRTLAYGMSHFGC